MASFASSMGKKTWAGDIGEKRKKRIEGDPITRPSRRPAEQPVREPVQPSRRREKIPAGV